MSGNARKPAVRRTWNCYRKILIEWPVNSRYLMNERNAVSTVLMLLRRLTASFCTKAIRSLCCDVGKLEGSLAKPLSKKCPSRRSFGYLSSDEQAHVPHSRNCQTLEQCVPPGTSVRSAAMCGLLGQAFQEGASVRVMLRILSAGDEDGHTSAHGQTLHHEEAICHRCNQRPNSSTVRRCRRA